MCCGNTENGIPLVMTSEKWGPDESAYWLRTARPAAGLMIGESSDIDAVYVQTDAGERVCSVARPLITPIPAGAVIRPVLTRDMSFQELDDASMALAKLQLIALPQVPQYAPPTARGPRSWQSNETEAATAGGGGADIVERWVTGARVATLWVKETGNIGLDVTITAYRPVGDNPFRITKTVLATTTLAALASGAWVVNLDTDPMDYLRVNVASTHGFGDPTTLAWGFEVRD